MGAQALPAVNGNSLKNACAECGRDLAGLATYEKAVVGHKTFCGVPCQVRHFMPKDTMRPSTKGH